MFAMFVRRLLPVVVWAVVAASGRLLHATELQTFVKPYNVLAGMLNERLQAAGLTNVVPLKSVSSTNQAERAVSQTDLNELRSRVVTLMSGYYVKDSQYFVVSNANPAVAFPFLQSSYTNTVFTKVPGEYRANGDTLRANDFTNVPPLWVHFTELYDCLISMRRTVTAGQWTSLGATNYMEGYDWVSSVNEEYCDDWWSLIYSSVADLYDSSAASVDHVAPRARSVATLAAVAQLLLPPPPWPPMCTNYLFDLSLNVERCNGYLVVSNLCDAVAHRVACYYFAAPEGTWDANGDSSLVQGQWSQWHDSGVTTSSNLVSARLGSVNLAMPTLCDAPTTNISYPSYVPVIMATSARGYSTDARAIITWSFDIPPLINPAQDDPQNDGLVADECECTDCSIDATVGFRGPGANAQGICPLGESSGMTNGGVRVRAYFTDYKVDGEPRQMFSLDTRADGVSDGAEGWEFVTVRRPSGADVVFSLQGDNAGKPVNMQRDYRLAKDGDSYELTFPTGSGRIVHRFGPDGGIAQVRRLKHHEETIVSGSSSNWPGMVTFRGADQVLSNVCSTISFVPVYEDGLVTHVLYATLVAGDAGQIEILPGSRIFRTKNASGIITSESRIVTTNGTEQIWSGVSGGTGTVTVARKDIRWESVDASNDVLSVYELAVLNPDTSAAQSNLTRRLIGRFPWGEELLAVTVGFGGESPLTTTYTYCTNSVDTNQYGRLTLVEQPDGAWTRHSYDAQGRESVVSAPFMNAGPTAATNACRVSRYYYAGDTVLPGQNFPASDVVVSNDARPRLVVEEILGQEVSRTYSAYLPDRRVSVRCVTPGAAYDAANNLVSSTYEYTNGVFKGWTRKIEREDGTLALFSYAYDSIGQQLTVTNTTGSGSDDAVTNGTMTITVSDARGRLLSSVSKDVASGITIAGHAYARDGFGRVVCESNTVSGSYVTRVYGCCGPEEETDGDGITTYTTYTDLKQVYAAERLGVTRFMTYDVNGAVTQTRQAASGEQDLVTRSSYDTAGRVTATTNEVGAATLYVYSTNANGGRVVVTTHADGGTSVENYYRDGQLASVTGSAVYAVCYSYGADTNGAFTVEYRGTDTNAAEWVKTYRNMLGKTWKRVYPGNYTQQVHFDAFGREIASDDGFTSTLTAYNDRSEIFRQAVDMDGNGAIDLAGTDRISEMESGYAIFDGKDVRQSTGRIYPTNGVSTPVAVSISLASLAGDETWTIAFGRTNHSITVRDRSAGARTETITRPDETETVGIYSNGLLRSFVEKSATGDAVTWQAFTYDGFNRLRTTTAPGVNGSTQLVTQCHNPAGAVTGITVSAGGLSQTTTHEFDSMGRRIRTVLPDGAAVDYGYNRQGALTSQTGARAYPVTHTFTEQGRLASLSTYRNGTNGTADTTTWSYDSARGWLTAKTYADSSTVAYAYADNGALLTRTWARGIETRYSYDSGGSLTNVSYTDGTTSGIRYSLDRLGRPATVQDGMGIRTNAFAVDGSLLGESLPQLPGGIMAYERDHMGRLTNVALSIAGNRIALSVYGYDPAGRLASVSDGSRSAVYSFGADGATWTNLAFGSTLNTRRSFDGLSRLSEISSQPQTGSAIGFAYSLNQASQRTTNTLADGGRWVYQYNERGEVVSGKKYFPDGQPVQGAQFGYEFDTIGNRIAAQEGTATAAFSYSANNLNQYIQRTVADELLVTGEAATGATVSVRLNTNGAALANRHGQSFWKAVDVANASSLFATTNLAVIAHLASGTQSLVRVEARKAVIPQTPEAFVWDADGNLLSDGLWTNHWDANNRIIATESRAGVPDWAKKRLTFEYDYMGRRTVKRFESGYSGGVYGATNTTTYAWDGWNIIAEISTCSATGQAVTNVYTWGLDLSGTLQGAGGVGGLLMLTLAGTNALPVCDGNGNVIALVGPDGGVAAEYEYGPFGQPLKAVGSLAYANPWRFSTKQMDGETGLLVYQIRTSSTGLGRWLSRDPIGEGGGRHLYGFVGNDSVSGVDYLGLDGFWSAVSGCIRTGVSVAGDAASSIVSLPGRFLGEVTSVVTLEKFQSRGRSPVNHEQQGQCAFLLTIAGMGNSTDDNEAFGQQVLAAFPGMAKVLGSKYWGFANNPVLLGAAQSILKLPADEIGGARVPSVTAAKYLKEAYAKGKANGCCDIDLLVVVHSQGGRVLANAVRFLPADVKKTMRILTLNAEYAFADSGEYAWVKNFKQEGFDIASSSTVWQPARWIRKVRIEDISGVNSHNRAEIMDVIGKVAPDFVPQR